MICAGWCRAGSTRRGSHRPTGAIRWISWSRPAGIGSHRCCRSAMAACRQSPFAFLRGSAAVMAADLATTPTSGIWVQSCGDCHLANFGIYAALDGIAGVRRHRFRRDAAGAFRMGPEAPRRQLRGRCARPRRCRSAPAAHLARGVVTRVSTAYGEADAARSAAGLAIARAMWRRCCRASPSRSCDSANSSGCSIAADAHRKGYRRLLERAQVRLAHPVANHRRSRRSRGRTTTRSKWSPAPHSRPTN